MGVMEAVGKGFGVAKKSMSLVLAVFGFGLVFNLLNLFLVPQGGLKAGETPSPILVVLGVVFILLTIFVQAGVMTFTRDQIKTGSATFSNFMSGGTAYYMKLLLLGLVVSLIVGVYIIIAAMSVGFLSRVAPPVSVVLAVIFAAVGIYFVVLLFLAPYAVVVDGKGIKDAITLSMKLVKRTILALLGITILMIVIGFLVGLVLGALLAGISILLKQQMATQVLFAIISSFANSFLGLFVTAAFMNFYLALSDRS